MTPDQYQQAAIRTECDNEKARERLYGIHGPETPVLLPSRLVHAALGLQNETGEIAKVLKSWLYYGKPLTAEHRANLAEEFGDALWFICLGLTALGVSLETTMEANIRKLASRYPDKFTEERAENRNKDAERMALSGAGNVRVRNDTHVFDSSMTCDYCGAIEERTKQGDICAIRVMKGG